MTTPNFLVVGGARCGTTGLVEGLRRHSQVFVTNPKEPHYFAFHRTGANFTAPGDEHTINKVSVTDRQAYLDLYPAEHSFSALGDASVSTLYYAHEALAEVVRMNPDMKLIALLREPVDRAYSAHQYMRARGMEPVEDFLEAVALEPERREAGWHHLWHYTAMSRYAAGVRALQSALPPEQIGIWFHDDLDSDYERVLREIFTFLGVQPEAASTADVQRVNVSGKPRSKMLHAVIGAVTGNERMRAFVKDHTSFELRERIRRAALSRGEGVPAAARQQLTPLFADDLAELAPLVSGPVPSWLESGARTP